MTEAATNSPESGNYLDELIPDFANQLGDVDVDMDIGEPFEDMLDSSVGLAYDVDDQISQVDQTFSTGTTDTDMELEDEPSTAKPKQTPLEDKASAAFGKLVEKSAGNNPKEEAKSIWLSCCAGRSPKNVIKKKPRPNCFEYGAEGPAL